MTPQSIYRLRTEGRNQASQYLRRSLRSLGGYNKKKIRREEEVNRKGKQTQIIHIYVHIAPK